LVSGELLLPIKEKSFSVYLASVVTVDLSTPFALFVKEQNKAKPIDLTLLCPLAEARETN
jgi:hypothetical protein